jgi:glucose-1-phosphate cytidylyltransferase
VKVILLAGGFGTRISEETSDKPKPMVLLDDKPILWHLMNIYALQGFTDFVIAGGYKVEAIRRWVETLDLSWGIEVLDTGLETQTGGRIRMCIEHIGDECVFATYGDGLGNVDLKRLLEFHQSHGKLATLTMVRPPARFGVVESRNGVVTHFGEKIHTDAGWINGGYFVLEPTVAHYVETIVEPFETGAIPRLVNKKELMAYEHHGFWQPMDTLREKMVLAELAAKPTPPWLDFQ